MAHGTEVRRYAIKFDPPTLVVEYTRGQKMFIKRIKLMNKPTSNRSSSSSSSSSNSSSSSSSSSRSMEARAAVLTDLIIGQNKDVLGPELASREQIEDLVQRILIGPNNSNNNNKNNNSSLSMVQQRLGTATVVHAYGDLNKASDEVLQQAKARMDVDFNSKRLKPGDNGYEWNKEVDFEPPTGVSEWDDDDDE